MRRFALGRLLSIPFAVSAALGAAPAAPTYLPVEQTIGKIRDGWGKPNAAAQPNAPGWNALFDALVGDLREYSAATNGAERLAALNKVYQFSNALGSVAWPPAGELRESLRTWLRPRVRLAWAERRLTDTIKGLPAVNDASAAGNRRKWVEFVDNDLGSALRRYDAASSVAERQAALKEVYQAIDALQGRNQAVAWAPSVQLEGAVNDLFNQPNFDVTIDAPTLSPVLNPATLVQSGPVTRKGYVAQVTAGPRTGFGLLPSDDGILFYNSQMLTSVTPIWDFQRQVEANQQGKRAAKMYEFGATSVDNSELTVYTTITTDGLAITPAYRHNVGADINTTPQQGKGFARAVAGVIGFNQTKITQLAYENAIGQIRSNIEKEAQEEGVERTSQEAAQRNVGLRQILVGGHRAVYAAANVLVEGLSLRSRADLALIGGKVAYLNAKQQVGADAPQPSSLGNAEPGVTADLHLASIMTNFARGYLQSPKAREAQNLMVVTQKVAPDAPPSRGVRVAENTDFPTYLKEVEAVQAANDPKLLAVRVKRPTEMPDFGVDARGFLVAIVHDFQLEVPAPAQMAKGGLAGAPAKVLRIVSPAAEFALSYKVESKTEAEPLRLAARIEDFDPGPQGKIYLINDDEAKATPMNPIAQTIAFTTIRNRLRGQPIDVPLSRLQLRGFAVRSVTPPDPSGWVRVTLDRTSASPAAGIQ